MYQRGYLHYSVHLALLQQQQDLDACMVLEINIELVGIVCCCAKSMFHAGTGVAVRIQNRSMQ
jgi:hypothetical protein